jgi:hypothetical protein
MKHSGPLSTSKIYYSGEQPSTIVCMDDPYWREFMEKNSKRENIWRTPSILAWNHKRYGIVGEVVDV